MIVLSIVIWITLTVHASTTSGHQEQQLISINSSSGGPDGDSFKPVLILPSHSSHSSGGDQTLTPRWSRLGRNRTSWFLQVLSSETRCHVRVNGRTVALYDKEYGPQHKSTSAYARQMKKNGMYAVTIHPRNGRKTGEEFAHGHTASAAFFSVEDLLVNTQPGRIIVLCVLAEAGLSMDTHGERLMRAVGGTWSPDLQTRSMYALVAVKGVGVVAEGYSLNLAALYPGIPSATLHLTAYVPRTEPRSLLRCKKQWSQKRKHFCNKYDGYKGICKCPQASPIMYPLKLFEDGTLFKYPIIILTSNRPRYLYRCLKSLLPNRGVDKSKILVFYDNEHEEMQELIKLMDVKSHAHIDDATMGGSSARIARAYKYTIKTAFDMFPEAAKIVLLEEDLEVSPDFVFFFQQTHHLLDLDPSLYCISAWNDNGYKHAVGDEALLYRVGFLPGLGWMLTRKLFFDEMLPEWPPPWKSFDWDVMFRMEQHRKGRDCVIPDISRTYHFGFIGQHVESSMQFKYYYDHAFNTRPDVKLRGVEDLIFHKYEGVLISLLKQGVPITSDGNDTQCSDIIPRQHYAQPLLLFMKMTGAKDTAVWQKLATCLNLWDLDVRGQHRGIWRFWYNGNHVLAVGTPYSELSDFGISEKQGIMVFGGERTDQAKRLGRWPPGEERMTFERREARQRYAAVELDSD